MSKKNKKAIKIKASYGPSLKGKGKSMPARLPLPTYAIFEISKPNLINIEIRMINFTGLEMKMLFDKDDYGMFRVLHEKYKLGRLIFREVVKIDQNQKNSSGSALNYFNSIVLGEV